MTKNPRNDSVGDQQSPSLKPRAADLRGGVDQANTFVAEPSPALKPQSVTASLRASAVQGAKSDVPVCCHQRPWLSFFFDGTGNNLDADVGTEKHSNVAKLYRVHRGNDKVKGIYRFYIPGVGTYFREVGDEGGSTAGLGSGQYGDARLDWALEQFDEKLSGHLARANSPGNQIIEINIAIFGFSRGAALARAFSNMLLEKRCVATEKGWCLRQGRHRLRIRFMGLFDTVASVGLPMSANTVRIVDAMLGVKQMIKTRLRDPAYEDTRPESLAFSKGALPGADPAPGVADGHQSWGGKMAIPDMVERVHHFVAAHEIRNSFPLDSVSVLRNRKINKPAQFHETVFPGAHSDVGGSYRPGEGARSMNPEEKLGLIPLHRMYQLAIENQVPFLGKTEWKDFHHRDFAISATLLQRYNYYHQKVKAVPNLGPLINAHMSLYYAWRFRSIRMKQRGNRDEAKKIASMDKVFSSERTLLDREVKVLEKANNEAIEDLIAARQEKGSYLQRNYGSPTLPELSKYNEEIKAAQERQDLSQDKLLRAMAKRDALPDMSSFSSMVDLYDTQLIADVKAIRDAYTRPGFFGGAPNSAKRNELRPHYKILVEAYENEFIHNNGLKDETVIAFFDDYVHDSLAGFSKDATLPSDPRVIYLGGDEKYKYATIDQKQHNNEVYYASARESERATTIHGEGTELRV